MSQAPPTCPLCTSRATSHYHTDRVRAYWRCATCRLVFVAPTGLPLRVEEKAAYDQHCNEVDDPAYRRFLSQLAVPLLDRLPAAQRGLDYGCGPGPALAAMLREAGHEMALYDPFYAADRAVLAKSYDFVSATEVVEHFHNPARDFTTLFGMLRPGGWLGVMTWMLTPQRQFGPWSYIRDLTHVCFYSRATFTYLAQRYDAELHVISERVVLFRAPSN